MNIIIDLSIQDVTPKWNSRCEFDLQVVLIPGTEALTTAFSNLYNSETIRLLKVDIVDGD